MNEPPTKALQFSLRAFLFSLILVGVGALAITRPSPLILQLFFTTTIFVFLFGVTISMFGRSGGRPFLFGFSMFGLSYLVIVMLVGDLDIRSAFENTPLLTTRLLQHLHVRIARPVPPLGTGGGGFGGRIVPYDPPEHLVRRLGHTVLAWVFAAVGGVFAQFIHMSALAKSATSNATEQSEESAA